MNRLDKLVLELGVKRNNIVLHDEANAIGVIDLLERENVKLFGFDTFLLFGEKIQPFMEYSPDYSKTKQIDNVYELARTELKKFSAINNQFVFEIVYGCESSEN